MSYRPHILASMPLFPAALSVAIGILLTAGCQNWILYGATFLVALCILAIHLKKGMMALMAVFTTIGILTAIVHTPPGVRLTGLEERYIGIVIGADRYNFSQRLVVRLCGNDTGAEILLNVHSSMPVVEPGDTVRFTVILRSPAGPDTRIPDLRSALRNDEGFRISAIADLTPESITGNSPNFAVSPPSEAAISTLLYRLKMRFVDLIYDSGISASAAAFISAVLTGDSEYISTDTRELFISAGTAHMLALSGMHVAVIAFIVSLLFFPLRLIGHEKWAMLFTLVLLWLYALLTGMSPSVVRAVIMASVILTGRMVQRSSSPFNSLWLAAILILLFSPWQLFSIGFQLSFAAVASILMFSFEFVPHRPLWGIARSLFQWVGVSVSAVIGTGALSAFYFHQIPLLFVIANIPAAILLPFIMGGELINVFLTVAGYHSGTIALSVNVLYEWLVSIISAVAAIGGATCRDIYFSPWLLIPYYFAVVLAWVALRRRRKVYALASGMFLLFFAGVYALTSTHPAQGEAYAVEYPYSTVIVAFDGSSCSILTDAPESQYDRVLNVVRPRLSAFAGRRGGEISVVNPVIQSDLVYADSTIWCFGDLTIAPVGLRKDLHHLPVRPRFALVSARYFGTMRQVIDSLHPDTVVIAGSIRGERRMKFISELDSICQPYRTELPVKLL